MKRVIMGAGFGALSVLVVTGCGVGEAGEAPAYNLAEAARTNLRIVAEAAGTLEPLRMVEVMSKASGEVVEVLVDTGDRVETGTLLARIDPRDVQNDFNQAQADYEVARERFQIAEAQLRRSENLLQAGVITDQEHENRNLDYANSQAALVRAETTMELTRVRLEDAVIRSPMAGTVLRKNVEEGQVITSPSGSASGGTVLLTIADLSVVQARSLVNESDVGRIEPGMQVTVHVDAFPDQTFQGQVEKVEPQAEIQQSVVNFPVIVRLQNQQGLLRPGMSANVTILLAERPNALALPNHAIVSFQEMAAAAGVLGVPETRLLADQSVFQELRSEIGVAAGPAGGLPEGMELPANLEAIRQQVLGGGGAGGAGGINPQQMQELARQFGGGQFGGQGGGGQSAGGAVRARGGQQAEARPGVVFVEEADGQLAARGVLIGVTDWSNSEILAGLEEGERVALLGGTQLQAQQGGMNQMMRQFGGAMPFRF
jgi:HlyD family secretion protein